MSLHDDIVAEITTMLANDPRELTPGPGLLRRGHYAINDAVDNAAVCYVALSTSGVGGSVGPIESLRAGIPPSLYDLWIAGTRDETEEDPPDAQSFMASAAAKTTSGGQGGGGGPGGGNRPA